MTEIKRQSTLEDWRLIEKTLVGIKDLAEKNGFHIEAKLFDKDGEQVLGMIGADFYGNLKSETKEKK